jgi:hypothetical protein
VFIAGTSLHAQAQTFSSASVPATSSIFEANPANNTDGTTPPVFALTAGSGRVLSFSSVTGLTGAGGGTPTFGPDGGNWFNFGTNVLSLGNISGVVDADPGSALALLGVFTNDSNSGNLPARQDYTGSFKNQPSFAPLLNQAFFIGDGRTGTGAGLTQAFLVPDGATRLHLGFADSGNFNGAPGAYADNTGSLLASFSVQAVPEPASLLMISLGLVCVAVAKARSTHARPRELRGAA